ncbi:protein MAINTENANCE OF MERISTEMS-like [Cicer arietinum]|uniref:protein MAINTENANCE OF MERISTEMS-like n=1 Tax=Cicer arietinum TaxID=3827 RepID=UPI003CC570E0
MTITLDDVSYLLHIPITSAFFSVNVFNKDDSANLLVELLGVIDAYAYAYDEFNVTDKSAFEISVVYLKCFRDLNSSVEYAWGIAALAYLYDNLHEADCCRPSPGYVEDNPITLRWKSKRDKGLVLPFRKALDEIDVDQVYWAPYKEHRVKRPFEDVSLFKGWIRLGPKMYTHLLDMVLHHYSYVQTIPGSPLEIVVDTGAVVQRPVNCANHYME